MIKKIILLFIAIIIISFLGIIVFEQLFGKRISNTLSDRSKEYIKSTQISKGTSQFSELLKKGRKDTRGQRVEVGECFSFIMPYKVFNTRQDAECEVYFGIDNPRGRIVAYVRDGLIQSFDEMEGVLYRKQTPAYVESQKVINGNNFLMFKNTTDGYQKTAFYYSSQGYYFIITLSASTEKNLDSEFEKILASITFDK